MEITVKKEEIVRALSTVLGVVEKRQTLPILANVLFEVDENSFKLTATNLESEVTVSLPLTTINSVGKITTSAQKLNELCRLFPDGEDINLSLNVDKLSVKTNNGKYSLSTLQSADFPIFDIESANPPFIIPAQELRELITSTTFVIPSVALGRYETTGLFVSVGEGFITTAAVDRDNMAYANLSKISDHTFSGIVPRKAVNEIAKLLSDQSGDAGLKINDDSLELTVGNIVFKSKLIAGNFPDFRRAIPSGESSTLEVNVKDFSDSLSRVSVLKSELHKPIRLTTSSDGVRIMSSNTLLQEQAEEFFPAAYNGDAIDWAFNVKLLQDIISHIKTETCHLNFFGTTSSCLIASPNSDSPQYVVLPLADVPTEVDS
ncbi:DNA polymerase III subunit beta [Gammaproteobacteria bacterium]|nr:DNA polymerase III subunit beta [Gammaproteobacteria bacterium]